MIKTDYDREMWTAQAPSRLGEHSLASSAVLKDICALKDTPSDNAESRRFYKSASLGLSPNVYVGRDGVPLTQQIVYVVKDNTIDLPLVDA